MDVAVDPALAEAVALSVSHAPPFSEDEWAAVPDLAVKYARDLSALQWCPAIDILILIGCDPVSVEQLRGLRQLRSLTIRDSGLRDLRGIAGIPLYKCAVPRNFVDDLSPLLDLTEPTEIDVTGNPLSAHSYQELVPELSRRGHRVKASGELAWEITVRLHAEGIPISCYRSTHGLRLCRPGLAQTDLPDYDHPVITTEEARNLLRGDPHQAYDYFDHDERVPRLLPH